MIDYRYNTISPYLQDKTRLFALSSGYPYGSLELDDEHLAKKMDLFINQLNNQDIYQKYEMIRTREFPNLDRKKTINNTNVKSDLLINDIFRQNKMIEEIYRRGLPTLNDIRKINDEITRRSLAASRGYEKHLVNFLNNLDSEALNRKSIQPIII